MSSLGIIVRLFFNLLVALAGIAACIVALVVLAEGYFVAAGLLLLGARALVWWLDHATAAVQEEIDRQ